MAVYDRGYSGSFSIPTPKGIYQAAGDTNIRTDYAYMAENMRTDCGLLATAYGTSRAFPALGAPIETFTYFRRRNRPDDPDVFVAAAGGCIYTYTVGVEGWVQRGSGYLSDRWSCVNYDAAIDGEAVDLLLMTNAVDGMIAVYGSDLHVEGRALNIGVDYANVKFAVLGRYAERIWGTGAPGYPDSIFYSRPYDPFDWTNVEETPELGGGMIQQPSWDGDKFTSLVPYGGYLLAIKQNSVFEIRGTDPSSFTVTQAFGSDGTLNDRTICADKTFVYFLTRDEIGVYDGTAVSLLARDALHGILSRIIPDRQQNATACLCRHVYYLALCIQNDADDAVTENNAVLEYDTERGTFMLRTGIRVKDFYALNGKVYFTQADSPYDVLLYNDPKTCRYMTEPMKSYWLTPWLDLDKQYVKSDFTLRFTAEAEESDVPIEITVRTEKAERIRIVMLKRGRHDYRVCVHVRGKRVQLRIGSRDGKSGFSIHGGVMITYAMDTDD